MTIKSDRWIRQQCLNRFPMIEPFEPAQVRSRSVQDPDPRNFDSYATKKVLSYGTSSFGYDIRAASEFKVFTNVNSTIVDPKNFDPRSFVEVNGDYCIIPPNSFALARTVEYFRIPRDVLAVCLGKSTYARCFSGDTKVALAKGTAISLKKMAKEYTKGERFFGYGISRKLGLVVTEFLEPRKIASGEEILRVTLDDGSKIDCTPDHLFLTKAGKYVKAEELSAGASLMPLYRYESRVGEVVYNPAPNMVPGAAFNYTYGLSDAFNIRQGEYVARNKEHRHHIDENTRNDYPTNIVRKSAKAHVSGHNAAHFDVSIGLLNRRFKNTIQHLRNKGVLQTPPESLPVNHKVKSVRRLKGRHDVYCLTSPETGNFALEAGVFVKNCGIIVGVTPLEPEWEGYLTLEFSNTTPLPAKIYANEGCAQLLFFQSDEPCEVSYKDRGGKYQGQANEPVTPKV